MWYNFISDLQYLREKKKFYTYILSLREIAEERPKTEKTNTFKKKKGKEKGRAVEVTC